MEKEDFIKELKGFIIETLDLEDIDAEDLDDDKPLMAEELGLDSIDLLELTVAIEKRYKVKIGNVETARSAFKSINTLAQFIQAGAADFQQPET